MTLTSAKLNICFAYLLLSASPIKGGDWPSFRGYGGQSLALHESIPTTWSVDDGSNVAWAADLPGRGVCGPIVVGGKVIVTASSGPKEDRLHVLAFDEATGKPLWQRQFWATGRTIFHPTSANAAPTPASDGKRIFAFYSSNDLICLDLDGNVLWVQGLVLDHPKLGNDFGMSSSPTVAGDVVIVQCEAQGDSFVAGFDTATGKLQWKIERPKKSLWASPMAVPQWDGLGTAIAIQSTGGVSLHEAATGSRVWHCQVECSSIPSTAVYEGRIYVPSEGLTAFSLLAGENQQPLWKSGPLRPSSPSPVIVDGRVYVIGSAGILVCGDAETGEVVWRQRLGGQFWATPVAVGNSHLVCINSEGTAFVVDRNDGGKILAENKFHAEVLGSPAVANNALFVRGYTKLWKIAARGLATNTTEKVSY